MPAVRAGAGLVRRGAGLPVPGRDPEPSAYYVFHKTLDRRRPDARARAGRLAGGDQAPRHQRRRLLQREQAMPFENPSGLANFLQMLLILAIPAALTATFGRFVGQPPPGLGHLRGDDDAVHRRGRGGLHRRVARLAGAARRARLAGANLEGKEVRFEGGVHRALHGRSPPSPRAAPSTRVRLLTRASAAWCRCSTCRHRRGRLRRRRLGPLRDAAVRPAGRVHRRPDGGPHARVPRQEDRARARSSS